MKSNLKKSIRLAIFSLMLSMFYIGTAVAEVVNNVGGPTFL